MGNSQRGFVNIVLIVALVALAGLTGYLGFVKEPTTNAPDADLNITFPEAQSPEPEKPAIITKDETLNWKTYKSDFFELKYPPEFESRTIPDRSDYLLELISESESYTDIIFNTGDCGYTNTTKISVGGLIAEEKDFGIIQDEDNSYYHVIYVSFPDLLPFQGGLCISFENDSYSGVSKEQFSASNQLAVNKFRSMLKTFVAFDKLKSKVIID